MKIRDLFTDEGVNETLSRIEKLNTSTQPKWGKMTVEEMLAHCNVAYDMALTNNYPISGKFKTWLISMFAKKQVVSTQPYPRNGRTAPAFLIKDKRDFATEKKRMIDNIKKVHELGVDHFEGKQSVSFGKLSVEEWNNLFSKHLDHHLTQFGV